MEEEDEYVIAQPAPIIYTSVKRFAKKITGFARDVKQSMKDKSTQPKIIHYGDGYFFTSEETSSNLDQLISEDVWHGGGSRVYDGEKLHMGKIMKWDIDQDDEFILVVKCEELAAGGNGGEKFKWTYYVCINK